MTTKQPREPLKQLEPRPYTAEVVTEKEEEVVGQHGGGVLRSPHRLTSQLKVFRWSALNRSFHKSRPRSLTKSEESDNSSLKGIKIGEPTLCVTSSSMDSSLKCSTSSGETSSYRTRKPPPPKPVDESYKSTFEALGKRKSSLAQRFSLELDEGDSTNLPFSHSTGLGVTCSNRKSEDLGSLPLRFDEFLDKAYASVPDRVSQRYVSVQSSSDASAMRDGDDESDRGTPSRKGTATKISAEQRTEYIAQEEEGHEIRKDAPYHPSTEKLKERPNSDEFDFGDTRSPQLCADFHSNHEETYFGQSTRKEYPLTPPHRGSEVLDEGLQRKEGSAVWEKDQNEQPLSTPKSESQESLGISAPEKALKPLQVCSDSSWGDASALMSSLDLGIDLSGDEPPLPDLRTGGTREVVSRSVVYRDAISRLNKIRILETQELRERIEQLEERLKSPESNYRSIKLLDGNHQQRSPDKIHGLPHIIPVNSSLKSL